MLAGQRNLQRADLAAMGMDFAHQVLDRVVVTLQRTLVGLMALSASSVLAGQSLLGLETNVQSWIGMSNTQNLPAGRSEGELAKNQSG